MRLAFALLLFANIAWYGWTHWVAAPDEPAATAAAAEGKGLLLAREASPAKAPARVASGSPGRSAKEQPDAERRDPCREHDGPDGQEHDGTVRPLATSGGGA